jgi:uncharacterized protein YndB with AHSA1/START domain
MRLQMVADLRYPATRRLHLDSMDRIEKQVTLLAPMSRVWRAITDARELADWFGVNMEGGFAVGKAIPGILNIELDEAATMNHQRRIGVSSSKVRQPENGFVFCIVERIEAGRYFSFRWIPYGIDTDINVESEPTTVVNFYLKEIAEGTLLTIV